MTQNIPCYNPHLFLNSVHFIRQISNFAICCIVKVRHVNYTLNKVVPYGIGTYNYRKGINMRIILNSTHPSDYNNAGNLVHREGSLHRNINYSHYRLIVHVYSLFIIYICIAYDGNTMLVVISFQYSRND